jgi:hypothetical protein
VVGVVGKWERLFYLVWQQASLGIVREAVDLVRRLVDRRVILKSKLDEKTNRGGSIGRDYYSW